MISELQERIEKLQKKLDRSEREIARLKKSNVISEKQCEVLIDLLWKTNAMLYQDKITAECKDLFKTTKEAEALTSKIFNAKVR